MNEAVLRSLKAARRTPGIAASLTEYLSGAKTSFLYNPESKKFSREATYAEAITGGTSIPDVNYIRSSGRKLELSDLLLDSFNAGKSLKQLIDGLEALLLPAGVGKPPKLVYFTWGSYRFGPAVLTSMNWEETAWLDGDPAIATVNLSLLQVKSPEAAGTAISESPTGSTSLTQRQKEDASKKAAEYLKANADKLKPEVKSVYASSSFSYSTSKVGDVSMIGSDGKTIGIIGRWDGYTFVPATGLFR